MSTEIKLHELFSADAWSVYASWDVTIDGVTYDGVGAVIGVPDYQIGTAKAAGTVRGVLDAWYADASDWDHVGKDGRDAVMGALQARARRLWDETEECREKAGKAQGDV
jgi:hypothetical protein